MKSYLLRSMLFVPGHNEKLLLSASRSNADAIIIDLEDSVMPESNKAIARELAARKVRDGLFRNRLVFVRINGDEKYFGFDVQAFGRLPLITGFILPKVKGPGNIREFDYLLGKTERVTRIRAKSLKIIPLIETTSAVLQAREIGLASDRVIAMVFGCEDYIADLDGSYHPGPSGPSFMVPRALLAMAARAAKVLPIDTVYTDIPNLEGFERFARNSRSLGFEGTLILHPKQIPIAHNAYSPGIKEIGRAREILRMSEKAEAQGKGVAIIDGKFIGPPLVKVAIKVLARDRLIQTRSKDGV